jgi:E1A/CREB-binding protein
MKETGYCCGLKLSFTPLALICYGAAACSIARDQPYFMYQSESSSFGVTVSDRYVYCLKCFEALPPEGINLSENLNDPPK